MTLRLHVVSDLHTEMGSWPLTLVDADVVVLAGDIADRDQGVTFALKEFADVPVVYVAGNHEYYGYFLDRLIPDMREMAAGSHVHVLENDQIVLAGVRFLGCTLWTDFELYGDDRRSSCMAKVYDALNDYHMVRHNPNSGFIRPADTLELHLNSRRWLEARLAEPFDGPTVVVTHHAPSRKSIAGHFKLDPVTSAFASNLEDLISHYQPNLWIHGHTHHCVDYRIGRTRIFSNQTGYPFERVPGARLDCVLTVD